MNQNKYIYWEGIVSIFVNVALFVLKLWAGVVSGSIALTADAWHTLSDSISSLAVIVGAKLASKKPDQRHPYGHGRWEYITSFIIAIFLGFIVVEFTRKAILSLSVHESADFGIVAIVVTVVSIVAKEALAQYAFFVNKKTNNATVKADAWHHRTDAFSSLIVLLGIFLKDVIWWIDGALGLFIAVLLLRVAYGIIKEAVSKILGENITEKEEERIQQIIDGVLEQRIPAYNFRLHNYGQHQELTFHIKLNPDLTIRHGHIIATKIEKAIEKETGIISTIHIEEL